MIEGPRQVVAPRTSLSIDHDMGATCRSVSRSVLPSMQDHQTKVGDYLVYSGGNRVSIRDVEDIQRFIGEIPISQPS